MKSEMLYHYTGGSAYLNIILKRTLWLTDINYQNDGYEGKIAKKHLEIQRDHPNYSKFMDDYLSDIVDYFLNSSPIVYMSCFSNSGYDNLSLYRTYTPTDGGYCIGFEKSYLENIQGASVLECNYDNKDQSVQIKAFLDDLIIEAEKLKRKIPDPKKARSLIAESGLRDRFNELSVKFKSPEFKDEKEYRLCFGGISFDKIEYRMSSRQNIIIPYREINLPNIETEVAVSAGPNSLNEVKHSYQILTATAEARGSKWKFIKHGGSGSRYRII